MPKEALKSKIRTVPHFPKQGIMFRDITTLIKDAEGLRLALDELEKRYTGKGVTFVAGIESRGFIFGAALADRLGIGFVPIRKKGKLPAEVIREEYELEYGKDVVEMHRDAVKKGDRVVLVDDLIATGGTALAACKLLEKAGAEVVECAFVVDLPELKGKERLKPRKVFTLVEFEGE